MCVYVSWRGKEGKKPRTSIRRGGSGSGSGSVCLSPGEIGRGITSSMSLHSASVLRVRTPWPWLLLSVVQQ